LLISELYNPGNITIGQWTLLKPERDPLFHMKTLAQEYPQIGLFFSCPENIKTFLYLNYPFLFFCHDEPNFYKSRKTFRKQPENMGVVYYKISFLP
jgi:hypothetical protein